LKVLLKIKKKRSKQISLTICYRSSVKTFRVHIIILEAAEIALLENMKKEATAIEEQLEQLIQVFSDLIY